MDDIFLEKIKDAAHLYVQTCNKHCPSRKACKHRHKRRKTRADQSCTREYTRFKEFAHHVSGVDNNETKFHTCDAVLTNLIQTAIDAALIDLQIARCIKRQAAYERKRDQSPLSHSAEMRETAALRAEIRLSMTLLERKQQLIGICSKIRSNTKLAYSSEKVLSARRQEKLAEDMPEIIREAEEFENMTNQEIWDYHEEEMAIAKRIASGDFSDDAPKENKNNEENPRPPP
jgi:hypothetical protein